MIKCLGCAISDRVFGISNVRCFGAEGDGINDDTAAIQNAVDALTNGGTVYLPPGTYRTTQAIEVNAVDGVRILGAGTLATVIRNENASGAPAFSFASRRRMEVSHLKIVGTPASGAGISFTSVVGSLIEAVEVLATGDHGIILDETILTELRRVHVGHLPDGKNAFHLKRGGTTIWFINCSTANNYATSSGLYSEPIACAGVYAQINVIGGAYQSSQHGIYLNSVRGLVISGTYFEANFKADIRLGTPDDENRFSVRGAVIEGAFANGNPNAPEAFVDIRCGRNILIMGSFSTGHSTAIKLVCGITDGREVIVMANEFYDDLPYDSGALLANHLPGSLKGISGIGAVAGNPKNLRGSVTVSGANTTETVPFAEPEDNAAYFVTLTVSDTTGNPATASTRAFATGKTALGFTVNLEASPGNGNSVTVDWILMR